MPRKVIVDVSPGIDGALALAMALLDPQLEVVAVTAVAGNVPAAQATRNVQAVIEQLDPPRWPRVGAAVEPDRPPDVNSHLLHGADGLGNAGFQVAELHNLHPSEKVIADEVRGAPEEITLLCLGPLTNVAAAMRRDPQLGAQLGQLFIAGGTVTAPGDVSPMAELNIYYDPDAARHVFQSPTTKTLLPRDVTTAATFTYNHLDQMPDGSSRFGSLLRKVLPFAYRAYRQELGLEGVSLPSIVALMALDQSELFGMRRLAVDVETGGELCRGVCVFDRRPATHWRPNMEVATEADVAALTQAVLERLARVAA